MEEDIRFGRIAGIPVGASWSLLVIVVLITWTIAAGVLPEGDVDYSTGVYWTVGALTAVAFLAALLAHEMAHALVARSRGMRVEGITLWMFGGVSRLGGEAPDARTELRVAIVGPLTSVAIGIGMVALASILAALDAPEVAIIAIAWLGIINIALAVFNMLPAYPLDGGRVLRSVIWRRTGDQRRATELASGAGVAFGYGLMALGAVSFVGGGGVGGIWLLFLGWIVLNAARAEREGFELRRLLRGVRVTGVMTADPVTVPSGLTVDTLLHDYVTLHRCSAFPIVDSNGTPLGLVTLSGLRDVPDDARATTTVDQVGIPIGQVVTTGPDDPVLGVLEQFRPGGGRRALVVDGAGVLVGIMTASDVERALEVAGLTAGPAGDGQPSAGPGGSRHRPA